jgi:hypothetical protein
LQAGDRATHPYEVASRPSNARIERGAIERGEPLHLLQLLQRLLLRQCAPAGARRRRHGPEGEAGSLLEGLQWPAAFIASGPERERACYWQDAYYQFLTCVDVVTARHLPQHAAGRRSGGQDRRKAEAELPCRFIACNVLEPCSPQRRHSPVGKPLPTCNRDSLPSGHLALWHRADVMPYSASNRLIYS